MKKISYSLLAMLWCLAATAQQSFDQFLSEVLENNLAFKARQSETEARYLENRIGLNPANPEVQGGYLWGSPSAIGNRKDFSVGQELDFPTVYHHQNKLAELRNAQADLSLEQFQLELEQTAAALWVDLVSLNQRIKVQNERHELAQRLASAYDDRLNAGDANRIDRNKAALNALQAEKQLARLKQEKQLLLIELASLNGNHAMTVENDQFMPVNLPVDFNSWALQLIESNPQVQWYVGANQVAEREVQLNKSQALPKITAGYMMENVVGEKFQGVTLGLSIPLWENKNTVKAAKQRAEASQLLEDNMQLQFRNELWKMYENVRLAAERVAGYRNEIEQMNQKALLDEALAAGQIALIEYLTELQYNYEAIDQLLDAERDLNRAWMQLKVLERN